MFEELLHAGPLISDEFPNALVFLWKLLYPHYKERQNSSCLELLKGLEGSSKELLEVLDRNSKDFLKVLDRISKEFLEVLDRSSKEPVKRKLPELLCRHSM